MCVVSMIADHYGDKWKHGIQGPTYPNPYSPIQTPVLPFPPPSQYVPMTMAEPFPITRTEFEDLKRQVLEMKELLIKAKEYDAKNNEPDCEKDEKVEIIKKVAELVGVDLSEIFNKGPHQTA